VQLPMIHLNGSAPETLLAGYEAAYTAVKAAEEAVRATAPHGRDYYAIQLTNGRDATSVAMTEHLNRVRHLQVLAEEYQTLANHCRRAIEEKARNKR
jgi:hypothetical protein